MMSWAIEVQDLTKTYGQGLAVDHLSFQVRSGTIHGFLGPNGAGKSTTMAILTGLLMPTSGAVHVAGFDVKKDLKKIRTQVGFLPEHLPLYLDMKVSDFLLFIAKLHGLSSQQAKKQLALVLEKLDLKTVSHRLIGNLSKGYRQRVGIAQALIYDPPILLLDEPMVGLDPSSITEIRQLLLNLIPHHTLFLSSHDLHLMSLLCSDVTVINKGKLVYSGSLSNFQKKTGRTRMVEAKVQGWKNSLPSFSVGTLLQVIPQGEASLLRFQLKENENHVLLGEQIIKQGLGLLSFQEIQPALEEIFLEVTQ